MELRTHDSENRTLLKSIDWVTIVLYAILIVAGAVSIYAATYNFDKASMFDFSGFSGKQFMWAGLSFILGLSLLLIDRRLYEAYAYPIYGGTGLKTQAYDESKCTDPSLIIYSPVRVLGNKTIVTNGDQTDTIYEALDHQFTFEQGLRARKFEPDAPNYTPRISGIIRCEKGSFNYALSILKSAEGNPDSCQRFTYSYENPLAGQGHFIHTYVGDGNPLPSFTGEPKLVSIPDDIDGFTQLLWSNLNPDNKISLFVRYINPEDQSAVTKIVNRYGSEPKR